MNQPLIFIVEDDPDIHELLRYNLQAAGYETQSAYTGEEAWKLLEQAQPDLMLLDWMLPGMNGLDLLQRMRRHPKLQAIPVFMLTAKGEDADLVQGIEGGADDYLAKPFSLPVLLARIKGLLRRAGTSEMVELLKLKLDPQRHLAILDGQSLNLTKTEFKVLLFLAQKPGWVFSRDQLIDAAHGREHAVTERAMDVTMVGLRKKMGEYGSYIETVRGAGYRFQGEA